MTTDCCDTCKFDVVPCEMCDTNVMPHSKWEPMRDGGAVSHPAHYNRDGSMECIDEMLLIFGREAVMHFCLLNAWKYRYRAADKNGAQDLAKSDWYLRKYRELQEET